MARVFYLTILSIIILFLPSCVSDLELISEDVYLLKSDKSNPNTKTYESALIDFKAGYITRPYIIQIRLGFVKAKNNETWVVKTAYSKNFHWWGIDKIRFYIDNGGYYEFNSMPNPLRLSNYPTSDGNYYEENIFIINQTLCCTLLKAKQIKIELVSQYNHWVDGDIEKADLKKLKKFIEYIDSNVLSQK